MRLGLGEPSSVHIMSELGRELVSIERALCLTGTWLHVPIRHRRLTVPVSRCAVDVRVRVARRVAGRVSQEPGVVVSGRRDLNMLWWLLLRGRGLLELHHLLVGCRGAVVRGTQNCLRGG